MAPLKHNEHLIMRIAVEAQLLAEEKWIIDALKKIKKERNCLQIEKLHLENLKNEFKHSKDPKSKVGSGPPSPTASQSASITSSALDLMQNPSSSHVELDLPNFEMYDVPYNAEELNLVVTNSVFNNTDPSAFDPEEEDEDMDCEIDMNMFMYGKESGNQCSDDKFDD